MTYYLSPNKSNLVYLVTIRYVNIHILQMRKLRAKIKLFEEPKVLIRRLVLSSESIIYLFNNY